MITFENILNVDESLQLEVMDWRNNENVRKNMFSDDLITKEQHVNWLKSLKTDKKNSFYVIFYENEPVGVFSFNNMSKEHLVSSWGFYLRQDKKMPAISLLIEEKIINYYFNNLGYHKLNCEVLETNPKIIKLHKHFGFQEEGCRRENIIKDKKRINVILLGLRKQDWESLYKVREEKETL